MATRRISESFRVPIANTLHFREEVRYLAEWIRKNFSDSAERCFIKSGKNSSIQFRISLKAHTLLAIWNEQSRHPDADATFHSRQLAVVVCHDHLRLRNSARLGHVRRLSAWPRRLSEP